MIGQSGKTVRPKLFLSIGASGAVHYATGFLKSKVIVAIDINPLIVHAQGVVAVDATIVL
jgi:electron transfer flavoprotein alpha subunit